MIDYCYWWHGMLSFVSFPQLEWSPNLKGHHWPSRCTRHVAGITLIWKIVPMSYVCGCRYVWSFRYCVKLQILCEVADTMCGCRYCVKLQILCEVAETVHQWWNCIHFLVCFVTWLTALFQSFYTEIMKSYNHIGWSTNVLLIINLRNRFRIYQTIN